MTSHNPHLRPRIIRLGPVTYHRRWWHLWTSRGDAWAIVLPGEPLWARPPVFGTSDDAERAARKLREATR